MINIIDTKISDVKIIEPNIFKDDRGYFFESYNDNEFFSKIGKINFTQDNQSKSSYGVLRGMHYQKAPYDQSKLIRVIKGEIQDVVIDLRKKSPTYNHYLSVILNDKNHNQLFVPKGFAHGFLVLSEEAIVSYKVDNSYNKNYEKGIYYKDKNFNIKWLVDDTKIITNKRDTEW